MCELPTVYDETLRKARKEHKCSECFNVIHPKSQYYDIKGLWDGEWNNLKAHKDCHDFLIVLNCEAGEPYAFSELIEAICNHLPNSMIDEFGEDGWTEETISAIKAKYELSLL